MIEDPVANTIRRLLGFEHKEFKRAELRVLDPEAALYEAALPESASHLLTVLHNGKQLEPHAYRLPVGGGSVQLEILDLADDDEIVVWWLPTVRTPTLDARDDGSVTRMVVEAIGRELIGLAADLQRARRDISVATAEGTGLEELVALLGLERGVHATTTVRLTVRHAPDEVVAVPIPRGSLFAATPRKNVADTPVFAATESTCLPPLDAESDSSTIELTLPVQAIDAFAGRRGEAAAGEITRFINPPAGIVVDAVTNDEPARMTTFESDKDLRARAEARLYAIQGGSANALTARAHAHEGTVKAVRETPRGAELVVAFPDAAPDERADRVHALQADIDRVRAAGVCVRVVLENSA